MDISKFLYKLVSHFMNKLKRKELCRMLKSFKSVGENTRLSFGLKVIHPEYITIGNDFYVEDNTKLQTWPFYQGETTGYIPKLIIGNNVSIMSNCQISCMNEITIGDGVLIGDNVFITDNLHGNSTYTEMTIAPIERKLISKGAVSIGNNVWLGRNVCIMPGVTIGDGAVIGANAVVTKNVPSYAVAAGVPADIIKRMR